MLQLPRQSLSTQRDYRSRLVSKPRDPIVRHLIVRTASGSIEYHVGTRNNVLRAYRQGRGDDYIVSLRIQSQPLHLLTEGTPV